jgi:tetratricopeptide (TPR) repeat protein
MTPDKKRSEPDRRGNAACRYSAAAIAVLALGYAFFAGFRTVGDMDLGWQMATGRWIVQHHAVPYTDVLSYTGAGKQWIYPVLSQVLFYLLHQLGGYSLLSWVSAAACVGTVALLLGKDAITNCLALIAVPLVASRTAPRAELFTELLFALFVSALWRYQELGHRRLWFLPLCMFLWVNLHLGFVSGLGMCVAYMFVEFETALSDGKRDNALRRLRSAWPWLAATVAATLLNPWGLWNYVGMMRLMPVQSNRWIVELMSVPLTAGTASQAFALRDPRSAVWWLIVAVLIALVFSAWQRRFVPAALLGASLYLLFHAKRFEGPFATVAVVIGGSILADSLKMEWVRQHWDEVKPATRKLVRDSAMWACVAAFAILACVRISDLVTNRYYLRTPFQFAVFGAGESTWFPEDAAAFVKRERLPGNVFNDYNAGGFAAWRLWPEYRDYIDGRGGPFGEAMFFRSQQLLGESLDSPDWRVEADSKGINTIFISLDFELGMGLAAVDEFCQSQAWRPVFLDAQSAVFVRVQPETASLAERLQVDCKRVKFDTPPAAEGIRGRAEQFNYYRNAAAILIVLGRDEEALHELELAEGIFDESGSLHYLKGLALLYTGSAAQAEQELRISLRIEPFDQSSLALAGLYKQQGRYSEAVAVLRKATEYSIHPYRLYLDLGVAELYAGHPEQALVSFDLAEKQSPFVGVGVEFGKDFLGRVAAGREEARRLLHPK